MLALEQRFHLTRLTSWRRETRAVRVVVVEALASAEDHVRFNTPFLSHLAQEHPSETQAPTIKIIIIIIMCRAGQTFNT